MKSLHLLKPSNLQWTYASLDASLEPILHIQRPQIYPLIHKNSVHLDVRNTLVYVPLTSQLEKPWNFLHSSDLPAQTLHFITVLKVFASYIKTLCSMNIFLRFSAIYLLLHANYRQTNCSNN